MDGLDIAAVSTVMQQSNLSQALQVGLMSMVKDQSEQNGRQLIQMMERSVQPHLGGSIDIKR